MNIKLKVKLLLALFFYISTVFVSEAQDQIILSKELNIDLSLSGKSIEIKENHSKEREILTDNTRGVSEVVYYSELDNLVDLEAKTTYINTKGKEKVIPIYDWDTSNQDSRGVFYSGRKKATFDYPKAIKGSKCQVRYKKEISEPQFVSSYIFADQYEIKKYTFKISYPKHFDIHLELRNTDSLQVNESIDTLKNKVIRTVIIDHIPKYEYIKKLKSSLYVLPHILVRIKSYEHKGRKIVIGETVDELYSWYSGLVKKIPTDHSPEMESELKNLVGQITKDCKSEEDKVEVILKWIQTNIKYIAFEDGMNGFIPRNAYKILHNRYGDCKDMANLTKTMLSAANIKGYLTWVGTRKKPYTYTNVPSVCTDNHMICSVKLNGEYVFLDATNENLPFLAVPSGIQGKQALIGLNENEYDLVTVPIPSSEYTSRVDSFQVFIDSTIMLLNMSSNFNGYLKEEFIYKSQIGKFNRDHNYYINFLNFRDGLSSSVKPKVELNSNFVVLNSLAKLENQIIKTNSKMYINLCLNNFYDKLNVSDLLERQVDIHEDYKYSHAVVTEFFMPEGYKVDYLPKAIHFEHELFSVNQNFEQKGDRVFLNQKIVIDYISLSQNDFESYNTFLKTLKKVQKTKLKLISNS